MGHSGLRKPQIATFVGGGFWLYDWLGGLRAAYGHLADQ
jgi:hypothetical protein